MNIIGRKKECDLLDRCLESKRPEFMVVYGRRRVGKTFLIREYFKDRFSFYATGVPNTNTREQLKVFKAALEQYGDSENTIPRDWMEAFGRLRTILKSDNVRRDPGSGKKVVFLDELPWMDTVRSDFKSAFDYFWNSWGSFQTDLLLIVCGSATSWIMNNLVKSTGGFYNRITRQMHLLPFTLAECEKLLESNGMVMTRGQIIDCYMIFGGIPYYLNLLDRRYSLPQNVDMLLFAEDGGLYYEYDRLFASLYKHPERHMEIIRELGNRKCGVTRAELASNKKIGNGELLTNALIDLEQCGFIRKYQNYTSSKQGFCYQLIDPFVLFCIHYLEERSFNSWSEYINSPGFYAWRGNAFEIVCLNHVEEIKKKLGVSGVSSMQYSWKSKESVPGVQIDLLIDRRDDIINICEMKYTSDEFETSAVYDENLRRKVEAFRRETASKKALHLTLVSAQGLKPGSYSASVQQLVTANDLFV